MDAKTFGQYLRELRKKREITLKDLGKEVGLSQPYLSQIENGEKGIPSPDILKKLAGPLGVEYGELMYEAGYLDEIAQDDNLSFTRIVVNDKVLRGEEAKAYLRSNGGIFKSAEEAEEASSKADELEMLLILGKPVTYFGNILTKDERKRILDMLELMFPNYVPTEPKD